MQVLETDFIKFWLDEGILYSEYKCPIHLTLENARKVVALRHQISDNEKQYWCYDIGLVKSLTKEARDYADVHGQDFLHASAIIVNSHVTMFLFNSFLRLKKLNVPIRVFTDKSKAVTWLKGIKKRNVTTGN